MDEQVTLLVSRLDQHILDDQEFQREILVKLGEIQAAQGKYLGIMGGVVLTVSAIWAIISTVVAWMK